MASFERSDLDETCAAASATGIAPPSILRQLRRVECMCRLSGSLEVHGNTRRNRLLASAPRSSIIKIVKRHFWLAVLLLAALYPALAAPRYPVSGIVVPADPQQPLM